MSPKRILPFLTLILAIYAESPCPLGQLLKDGVCKLCFRGRYSSTSGKSCIKCPAGTFQPLRGVQIKELCRPCPPETFSEAGAASCQPCPEGQRSRFRSSRCVKCEPGKVFAEYRNGCAPCSNDQYEQGGECKQCPLGLRAPKGATSIDQCTTCDKLGNCPRCFKGTFLNGSECIDCPPGFVTRREGSTDPSQCIPCPAGTFYVDSYPHECLPCGRTFTSSPGATMCRNPKKPCPEGTFETNNKNCMKCKSGFRFDPKNKSCIQCGEDEGSPGGVSQVCTKCGPDKVKDYFEDTCVCRAGTFLLKDNTTCKECPLGHYSRDGSTRCKKCSLHTFANSTGQEECHRCSLYSFSERGAKRCTPCPEGQMRPTRTRINGDHFPPNKCVIIESHCPPGSERVLKSSRTVCRPTICPSRTPVEEIGKTCTTCPGGTVLDETEGSPTCKPCGEELVSKGGFQTECTKCKNGFFKDSRDPSSCSCRGFRATGRGVQEGKCVKCPLGTSSQSKSSLEDFTCEPCPPGTSGSSREFNYCRSCPFHTFSTGGAQECTPCPPGFVTKRTKSTSRKDCIRF